MPSAARRTRCLDSISRYFQSTKLISPGPPPGVFFKSMSVSGLKVCILTDDAIGDFMGAGGLRALRFAKALRSSRAQVTIFAAAGKLLNPVSGNSSNDTYEYDGFTVYPPEQFENHHGKFDAAVAGTLVRRGLPGLKKFRGIVVHDLICPFMLENLSTFASLPNLKRRAWEAELEGDFLMAASKANAYLVASEMQSAFWAGYFTKAGLWSDEYASPPPVVIAPSGVESPQVVSAGEMPEEVQSVLEKLDARKHTHIIATSGGLYRWLEIEPLLLAVKLLKDSGFDTTLLLTGLAHPSHPEQSNSGSIKAVELIKSLGLDDEAITCGWLPHNYRFEALRRAKLGVNLHPQGLETQMSYRNRLLDFVSVEVPVVTSTGGVVSDRLIEYGIALPIVNLDYKNIADVLKRSIEAEWGKNFRFACASFRQEFDADNCAMKIVDAINLGMHSTPPKGQGGAGVRGNFSGRSYIAARRIAKKLFRR